MKVEKAPCGVVLCLCLFVAVGQGYFCSTQSLHGIQVGGPSASLESLGASSESDSYKGMAVQRWNLPNGNSLSVTVDKNGKVAYIESDWNGKGDDPESDLPGLRFGRTTLAELRKKFGSNGFGYKARGYSVETPDGVVMMNSYEASGVVITFYTKVNRDEYARVKSSGENPQLADYARLDAISIAASEYASSEWGDRVYDPSYKKIEWK